MKTFENLFHELVGLNKNYELLFRELENSVSFILDTPTKVPFAIHRQLCMKNEINIIPIGDDKVNVVGNTVYLDFRTPNENYHFTEILSCADLDAVNIHNHIQEYIKIIAQKFKPSEGLAKIAGASPKPIFWIREFVTCHIERASLWLPNGEIKLDIDLMGLGDWNTNAATSEELEQMLKRNVGPVC